MLNILVYLQLLLFKAFPALFDWVSYPITIMMKDLYKLQMRDIRRQVPPNAYHVELIACLERLLCFCHTGSTKVFVSSLMGPLGLSRSALADGFPMLNVSIFAQSTLLSAMNLGFEIIPGRWPKVDGHPAIASKAAQVFSYSLQHFIVRDFS